MLGDEKNGNDGKPEEAKAAVVEEVPAKEEKPGEDSEASGERLNKASIKDGVMTVQLYLEESNSAFAAAIGSLVLAQDMVRNYFAKKMMAEQLMKEKVMTRIIRPDVH